MKNKLSPIVLFVYNRPWHTKQTVEALQKNELAQESELFIYSDEAKNEDAQKNVEEVREYIDKIDGFKKVTIIKREKNWGLADSIIDGVTKIVNEYGKIIVLEDDLVTSPYFLKFMNEALEFYKDEEQVYSITGYSFTDEVNELDSTYFLPIISSWGWATWSNKWKVFERNKDSLKDFIKNKFNHNKFNFFSSYDYLSMAKLQLDDKIDSWAIYWYFSVFKKNGLTLYPAKSLIQNIGFDGSGAHCGNSQEEKSLLPYKYLLTNDIYGKEHIMNKVVNILKEKNNNSILLRIMYKLKNFVKIIFSDVQKQKIVFLSSKFRLVFYKKKIGKNSYVDKTVNVFGWSHVSIGHNTLIGEQSWLNVNGIIKDFEHIKIGNYCYIGRRNLISSSKELIIGDYVMTNNECKFLGSNHIYEDPLEPYIATGTTNGDIMKIGANTWVGAGTIVLGAVDIGHGSIIGAGSVVTKDIPPFSIAVGNPCKVIKRFNFKINDWEIISNFDNSLENLMPKENDYLEILKANKPDINMPKMAATSRYGDLL